MWRTFNCGIGFVLLLPAEASADAITRLRQFGLAAYDIGQVVEAGAEDNRVHIA